ncbi:MAG: hypothetical protein ABEJ72_11115, partial [Candidatus Aenigmatarchaeota archaeon]
RGNSWVKSRSGGWIQTRPFAYLKERCSMVETVFVYSLLLWLVFMVFAIINGITREKLYRPRIGEWKAHVISTFILVTFIALSTYLLLKYGVKSYTSLDLLLVGVVWSSMTVTFEFLFGHFAEGYSWQRLLKDYNLLKGRVWIFVPLTLLLSPYLIGAVI